MGRLPNIFKYLTPNTFLRKARLSRKLYYYTILAVMALSGVSVFLFQTYFADSASAAWFNENWLYRKSIEISTHTALERNVYINLTGVNDLDTSDTSKFQSDCGDLRFTDAGGNLLQYYIVSGCGTADTVVHVQFEVFPSGAQSIYYYYGNPLAGNGFSLSDFSTEASNYSLGSQGSEENSPRPMSYWKFDEGRGNVASSSGSIHPVGLFNSPVWHAEEQCVVGKCLYFDGTNDYGAVNQNVDLSGTNKVTVQFWMRWIPPGSSDYVAMEFSSNFNTDGVKGFLISPNATSYGNKFQVAIKDSTGGTYNSSEFDRPSDYTWHHYTFVIDKSQAAASEIIPYIDGKAVAYTKGNANNTSENFGNYPLYFMSRAGGSLFGKGFLDDIKIYPYALSATQVKANYIARGSTQGSSGVLGAKDYSYLSNGLVGYWKMDEVTQNTCNGGSNDNCDFSGNGFDGLWNGNATASMSAKFGAGATFDGTGDYITTSNSTTLQPSTNLTVAAWFKSSTTGNTRIISKGSSNQGYELILNGSNRVEFNLGINSTEHDIISDSTGLANGAWHHVVGTYDGTTMKMYIDGVLQADSENFPGTITYGVSSLTIGANVALTGTYTGVIDDVRVYNRTFSSNEVASLYDWAPGPIRHWSFEDPSRGNSVTEVTGNGATGTWLGTGTQHWDQGKYGQAGKFVSATTDRINTGGSVTATGNISIMTWVKVQTVSSGSYIYWKNSKWTLSLNELSPGVNFGQCRVSCGYGITRFAYTFEPGKWYHIAITSDNARIYAYVNGVLIGSAAFNGVFTDGNGNEYIGGTDSVSSLNANLDDLKIYDYARSAEQIVEDMNAGHPAGGSPVGSMIGHWKFDAGSGNVASNSGSLGEYLNAGMYNMSNPASVTSGWTNNGKVNKALLFDGTNDRVEIPDTSELEAQQFSISAWVNTFAVTGSLPTDNPIISKYDDASSRRAYIIGIIPGTRQVRFSTSPSCATSNSTDLTSNKSIDLRRWYHITAIFDGSTLKIYLDGKLDNSIAANSSVICTSIAPFVIGGRYGGGDPTDWFNGMIDEVKYYNYALNDAEVRIDYNGGSSLRFGVLGTDVDGKTASNSASRMYCPPGDTTAVCAPVGEWRFEEKQGGNTRDSSTNGRTGVLTLGPVWSSGKVGSGLKFSQTDGSFVSIGDSALLSPTSTVSLSSWVRLTSYPTGGVSSFISKTNSYALNLNTTGAPYCGINASISVSTSTVLPLNYWNHVVCTYDSVTGTANIYINGRLANSSSAMGAGTNITDTAVAVEVGRNSGNGRAITGTIDEVRIFNYVLSPSQVAWDYNRGKPVAYYKMDDCQGTSPKDSSGNGKHGTLTLSAGGVTSAGTCSTSSTAWGNGASGKYNYSLSFDGTDDYVSLPIGLDTAGDTVKDYNSVSFWMYPRQDLRTTAQGILSSDGTDDCGDLRLYTATNQLNFFQRCYGSPYVDITNDNFQNTWTHVVVTFDGGSQKVYINGRQRTLINAASQNINWVTANVGRVNQAGVFTYFDGIFDEFQVFNYPLSAAQVKNEFNQSSAVRFGPATGAP